MTTVNNFERQFLLSWAESYKYVKVLQHEEDIKIYTVYKYKLPIYRSY